MKRALMLCTVSKTNRRAPVKGQVAMTSGACVLDPVHGMGEGKETGSVKLCESPLCRKEFHPTSLPWVVQRFCSEICRQQFSLITRAAKLLAPLTDGEIIGIMRRKPER